MDMDQVMRYAPKAIILLIAVGLFFELRKYKRNNDIAAWMRDLYAKVTRAATDENFRRAELADAEEKIANYPVPDPVIPLSRREQISLVLLPKFMLMAGLTGIVTLYLGLFETMPTGVRWPVYLGWGFLGATLVMYLVMEKTKRRYSRAQQINRKYLLQKAGGEKERFDSLREVLEYYPTVSALWLELGDQYAVAEQMDKAVEAVEKARELEPKNLDYTLVLASFSLRRKHHGKVETLLEEADRMKQAASDPRVEIYRGGLALQKNEKRKAEKHCRAAMELDKEFTTQLLLRDKGLGDLAALWRAVSGELEQCGQELEAGREGQAGDLEAADAEEAGDEDAGPEPETDEEPETAMDKAVEAGGRR